MLTVSTPLSFVLPSLNTTPPRPHANNAQAEVQPGIVAVEVSVSGAFFHGLPRVRELEISGRTWTPPRRVPACAGCASKPLVNEDAVGGSGEGNCGGVHAEDGARADLDAQVVAPSAHRLIAELQQPVALPIAPVLEAGAAAAVANESITHAVGSEVFLFVHGLGEDFGNGEFGRKEGGWVVADAGGGGLLCS